MKPGGLVLYLHCVIGQYKARLSHIYIVLMLLYRYAVIPFIYVYFCINGSSIGNGMKPGFVYICKPVWLAQ